MTAQLDIPDHESVVEVPADVLDVDTREAHHIPARAADVPPVPASPFPRPGEDTLIPRVWLASLAVLLGTLTACEPERGGPSGGRPADPPVPQGMCRARASQPFTSTGPRSDGPGLYTFISTAEGTVICSKRMHWLKVTVVFHHQTNGSRRGAVQGRDHLCSDTLTCDGDAIYGRSRLNCVEAYRYDDYTQITGWYVLAPGNSQVRIDSAESRHRVGTSYKPPQVCK